MKLRNPLLIRVIAAVMALVIRLWLVTMRIRMVSADGRRHPVDPRQQRYIYAFWHDTVLAPLATRAPVQVLISEHADGELITQVCRWLGVGAIRGSSTRGGSQALLEMIRSSDREAHLVITPDGPRGPRHELKAGVVMVASQTGLPVVPVGIGFSKAWRARSWDRFAVPVPLGTMVGVVGEPILVPKDLDRGGLRHFQQLIDQEMQRLTAAAETWAARLRLDRSATPEPVRQPSEWSKSA